MRCQMGEGMDDEVLMTACTGITSKLTPLRSSLHSRWEGGLLEATCEGSASI